MDESVEDAAPAQRPRAFLHAAQWNMSIDIAAPKEHRRAVERALIVPRRSFRSDEARAQSDHAAVAPGIARGVLQSQAPALGKAEQHHAIGTKALRAEPRKKVTDGCQ